MSEKKKNRLSDGQLILTAAFLICLCLSGVIWQALKNNADTENPENRKLAEMPKLTADTYTQFSSDFESYFNDHLPFRNDLIRLNNMIDYFGFRKTSDRRVIAGEDNWLFFNDPNDGDPMRCYSGGNLLSEETLKAMADNCVRQRDFLAEQGKEFVLFIAPNKERVYSEMMPDQYGKPAEQYMALQLVQYLRENTDLRVVYPYEELIAAKERLKYPVWYKTDTHWNEIGGYIGARALMEELGIDMPPVDDAGLTIRKDGEKKGDLAAMLNLADQLKRADFEYSVEGYDDHQVKEVARDFSETYVYHAKGADERKIYIYRDSFSSQMADYIGSQFNDTYMRFYRTYTYEDFLAQDPDIFVYEAVERYLPWLMTFSIQSSFDADAAFSAYNSR